MRKLESWLQSETVGITQRVPGGNVAERQHCYLDERDAKRHPAGTERHKARRDLGAANQTPADDLFLDFTRMMST